MLRNLLINRESPLWSVWLAELAVILGVVLLGRALFRIKKDDPAVWWRLLVPANYFFWAQSCAADIREDPGTQTDEVMIAFLLGMGG